MKRPRSVVVLSLVLVGIVALLVLGFLLTRIGGVSIRSSVVQVANLPLRVVDPLVPGVPTRVTWDAREGTGSGVVQLILRDRRQEHTMGEVELNSGVATGAVPCDVDGAVASVVLREVSSGAVYGFQEVEMLPPGPECVLAH